MVVLCLSQQRRLFSPATKLHSFLARPPRLVGRTADGEVVTLHPVEGSVTGPSATVELVRGGHHIDVARIADALTREP